MSSSPYRMWSVALAELKLRFGRTGTWILFLLLCGAAFLLMPDVGANAVMFLIKGRRVVLDSAATSLTSALLGGFTLSLFGFYFVSDSVTRDARTGVGRLIAPSPVSSTSYLAGKFLGNTLFLYTITVIFMIACMIVHMIRGEAPLEAATFIRTFALMFIPLAPSVAALALMFECVSFLAGRIGDVLYFLVWITLLGLPVAIAGSPGRSSWLYSVDISGVGFFMTDIIRVTGSTNITIGYAPYDATLAPVVFPGLDMDSALVLPRMFSILLSVPVVAVARVAFRRFDPAQGKVRRPGSGLLARWGQALRSGWLRSFVPDISRLIGPPSLSKAIILDAHLTLANSPIIVVVMIVAILSGCFLPVEFLRSGLMPVMFVLFIPILSTVSTRDRRGNVAQLIFSTPFCRRHFVSIKFLSALTIVLLLSAVPVLRFLLDDPSHSLALFVGLVFVAALATFFGILTGTPKAFTVMFLLFLYVSLSSRTVASLDFAGLSRVAMPGEIAGYAAISALMLATAFAVERWKEIRQDS